MKRGPDGTITVAKANERSRSKTKEQLQQVKSRSKSRSKKARSKSRQRPMTYSAVIQGKEPLTTEVIKAKFIKASTSVRVQSVREHKEGALLIQTVTAAELDELIEKAKQQDALVAVKPNMTRRIVLMDVKPDVNAAELMVKLYNKNINHDEMQLEEFSNSTKLIIAPLDTRKLLLLEIDEVVQASWSVL